MRIFLASDDTLVRAGLAARLAADDGLTVVEDRAVTLGDARGGLADVALVDAASALLADVVLVDAASRLDAALPGAELPAIVLCEDAAQARAALAAGARGVLARDLQPGRLADIARAVLAGAVVVDGVFDELLLPLAGASLDGASDGSEAIALHGALTPRELEVLDLLAEGLSNREVAEALDISAHTAKFHVNAILDKLDARSRTEAVVRAARLGLLVL